MLGLGLEPQIGWRLRQEALLDAVEGALGEDVDAVDYVVKEALVREDLGQVINGWACKGRIHTTGG